jgi:ADP-heptose:LPS heptosyltransferase
MKNWILRNFQSPGDILMLTAAVRDLHRCHPGKFRTDVRTSCPDLWKNNPYITPLSEKRQNVEVIDCQYPLIHQSNTAPYHFIHGFIDFLNTRLPKPIRPGAFKGDIHLSAVEKKARSRVASITGRNIAYWIIVAGGKYDCTTKWWHFRRYQAVVEHFRDRILFVQVGEAGHYHPDLHGVLDLRGKTSTRELIQLVYHAQGVLCPVTFLMHLAAAVEVKNRPDFSRPCVVVAGGREPPQWESYPNHQFIHTIGALQCCASGGCWRARTIPLGDGDEKDAKNSLCEDVVDGMPRCMHLITAEEVIRRIQLYFEGGMCKYLTRDEAQHVKRSLKPEFRRLLKLPANPAL